MTLKKTTTVISSLVRGILPLVLFFQTLVLRDVLLHTAWKDFTVDRGSWRAVKPHQNASVPVRPSLPVPRPAVPSMVTLVPKSDTPPSVTWDKYPRNVTGIIERLRGEVGFDVSVADFRGPGTLDAFWTWSGLSGPTTPSWMRASVRTGATPFGRTLNLNFYTVSGNAQVNLSLFTLTNARAWFPEINLELFEYPLMIANNAILFSPRVGVWAQPPKEATDSSTWKWGGLWLVSLEVPLAESWGLWLKAAQKTEGWAPGFDDPGASWSLQTGVHLML